MTAGSTHSATRSGSSNNRDRAAVDSDNEVRGPITAATRRLIATAESFDDADLAAPSLCDGWTRAHVLAHVARNAESLVNLLTWARTGTPTFQYSSAELREAGIQAGTGRTTKELVDDVEATAERFAHAVNDMPDEGWAQLVNKGVGGEGDSIPARRILWMRLTEVEVHHVDLNAGYEPANWPDTFTVRALTETMHEFARRHAMPAFAIVAGTVQERTGDGGGRVIRGTPSSVLAWLTGRSDGADLTLDPAGSLPSLPAWK